MLRVLDEHKDHDVDRRYRPELPVPRGSSASASCARSATAIVVARADHAPDRARR